MTDKPLRTAAELDKALDWEFYCDDFGDDTSVREYLHGLLEAVWDKGESFSGKHPFGNSGWESTLALPLIESGVLEGTIDRRDPEYPEATGYDETDYNGLVFRLIAHMCGVRYDHD